LQFILGKIIYTLHGGSAVVVGEGMLHPLNNSTGSKNGAKIPKKKKKKKNHHNSFCQQNILKILG
jgi:hypothetical protein